MTFVNYFKKFYWGWRIRYSLYSTAKDVAKIEKLITKELNDRDNSNK